MPLTTKVTAHRGSSAAAPENTLAAIELAIRHRADYAEIDVQLSSDGEVVVIHDTDLRRVAGRSEWVSKLTLVELKQVDVGSRFSAEFAAERIPTLAEVLTAARGRLRLNIELKPSSTSRELAARVVALVERSQFEADCLLSSRDLTALEAIRRHKPDLPIGRVVKTRASLSAFRSLMGATARADEPPMAPLKRFASWRRLFQMEPSSTLDVDFLSVKDRFVSAALIEKVHEHGKEIHVWTVNDARRMQALVELGVDNVMTDTPDVLVKLLEDHVCRTPVGPTSVETS